MYLVKHTVQQHKYENGISLEWISPILGTSHWILLFQPAAKSFFPLKYKMSETLFTETQQLFCQSLTTMNLHFSKTCRGQKVLPVNEMAQLPHSASHPPPQHLTRLPWEGPTAGPCGQLPPRGSFNVSPQLLKGCKPSASLPPSSQDVTAATPPSPTVSAMSSPAPERILEWLGLCLEK